MSRLSDLLDQLKRENPRLGADLQAELTSHTQRTFGLVFEKHLPENVELPGRTVRRGDSVHILPPRGSKDTPDTCLWRVDNLRKEDELGRVARLVKLQPKQDTDPELRDSVPVSDLVVVAQHNETIYPGLVQTGEVIGTDAVDAPFHSVINAENFHALKMLTYTHYHSIDCIYIDPPYNTGAKDWKYNNDYVDSDDGYRHSKWLSFMERRLLVAKQLLNPEDSALIVTIDEKEYLRLGMLLEQTFPEARITMVTSSINAAGVTRKGTFGRSSEYLYFVQLGESKPTPLPLGNEWNDVATKNKTKIRWNLLMRSGTSARRIDSPNQFYPVFIRNTADGPIFESVGDSLIEGPPERFEDEHRAVIWPIRQDGSEGRWQISPAGLREAIALGYAKLGAWRGCETTVYYLKRGEKNKVETGIYPVTGRAHDGSVIVDTDGYRMSFIPTDIWRIPSHDAGNSGSRLVAQLLPGQSFPFPKSLYAVEDALRFFVKDKPDATILDFFSGSGTTAHAVMRLNKQDGGRRRSISVTNNEVSAEEQKALIAKGLRPGDEEWEALGIANYVTKPRVKAAITGKTPAGDDIKGSYKFTDEFPMKDGFAANAKFFTLTYEDPLAIQLARGFNRIAPLLWLRAGQQGPVIDDLTDKGYGVSAYYGVIESLDYLDDFIAEVEDKRPNLIYIITDDRRQFQHVAGLLPSGIDTVRLYESYLTNFKVNTGRYA